MTILVTAASGHLGRLTVLALLERGTPAADLVATSRDVSSIADLAERGVTTRRADYDDRASLDAALAGVDSVLLVSGDAIGSRVPQHRAVVEAAAAAGVRHLVYTSAPHADTAGFLIAQEHRETEEVVAASGLPATILRNDWYLENYTGNLEGPLATGTVVGSAGEGRVSAAGRADYAEAAAVVLLDGPALHAGRTYELGGDTAFTMTEYAAALGAAAGRDIAYADLPREEHVAALTGAGVPQAFAEVLADSDAGIARGELLVETGDLSRLLGRPTTTLDDALRTALA